MGAAKNEILSSSSKKTVAIIGAGVSGLQAARTILNSPDAKKFDVVIFEARDRIGGRAWTNHPWNFPLDFGIPPPESWAEIDRSQFHSRNRRKSIIRDCRKSRLHIGP
jgi:monoamine oxidase